MSDTTSSASGGIGVLGLLGVAFVVLKLTHLIDWSWWWVTLPFWGGVAVVLAIFAVVGVLYLLAHLADKRTNRRARIR